MPVKKNSQSTSMHASSSKPLRGAIATRKRSSSGKRSVRQSVHVSTSTVSSASGAAVPSSEPTVTRTAPTHRSRYQWSDAGAFALRITIVIALILSSSMFGWASALRENAQLVYSSTLLASAASSRMEFRDIRIEPSSPPVGTPVELRFMLVNPNRQEPAMHPEIVVDWGDGVIDTHHVNTLLGGVERTESFMHTYWSSYADGSVAVSGRYVNNRGELLKTSTASTALAFRQTDSALPLSIAPKREQQSSPPLEAPVIGAGYHVSRGDITLSSGAEASLPVVVMNAGTRAWARQTTHLSYHFYNQQGQLLTRDGLRTDFSVDTIEPGATYVFTDARIGATQWKDGERTPLLPGRYYLRWDLVYEGDSVDADDAFWFSTKGVTLSDFVVVNVTD